MVVPSLSVNKGRANNRRSQFPPQLETCLRGPVEQNTQWFAVSQRAFLVGIPEFPRDRNDVKLGLIASLTAR
jgi:hypothetical protein